MSFDPLLYGCQGQVDSRPEPKRKTKVPTPADAPLQKITLNLYAEDVEILKRVYGHGWSTHIREIMNIDAQASKRLGGKRTLGDLDAK